MIFLFDQLGFTLYISNMKHFFTLFFLLLLSFASQAQLPTGATAPNFIGKDINGRVWNLYDILATGRPVVVDISATWCGPCWAYHNSGALESFYAAHGPEGDAKSMVFFIEGDGATNTACLYGPTGCNNTTQGNWVAGSPYPILDNASIANSYDNGYFPTIYVICPDKTVEEVGQVNAATLWSKAAPCVGSVPANYASIDQLDAGSRTLEICNPQSALPVAHFTNLGTAPIQSAEIALRWNGDLLQTKSYSGLAGVFDISDVAFDQIEIPGAGVLSAEIVTINGQPNAQPNSKSVTFVDAPEAYATQQVVVYVRTDGFANDTYWGLYDDAGNLVYHGGNEQVGPNGGGAFPAGAPADPSAYPVNTIIKDTVTVPAGCISFKMVDARGDGLQPPGHYKLFELGNTAPFYIKVGNFGGSDYHTFSPKSSGVSNPELVSTLDIYPNPTSDVLHADYTLNNAGKVSAWVSNATGQIVWKQSASAFTAGIQTMDVPVQNLNNGVYWLSLQTTDGLITRRFAIAR